MCDSNDIIIIPEDDVTKKRTHFSIETDVKDDNNGKSKPVVGSCLFYGTIFSFILLLAVGFYTFYRYDRFFETHSKEARKNKEDSLQNRERTILSGKLAMEYLRDSLLNAELNDVREADSLELVRKRNELLESHRQDSIRVDTFMTHVIKDISKSNEILARYLDGKNYVYYYTNKSSRVFNISCFDGVSKQIYNIISDIDGKYAGHIVSPDYRFLIILCKNQVKKLCFAYKVEIVNNTYIEYNPYDDKNNQCYDIGKTENGFCMKFGKISKNSQEHQYTCYYDRFGNYITEK